MEGEISIDTLKLTKENVMKRSIDGKLLRVHPRLYKANPEAYTPLFVSVGPFHHIGQNFKRFKDANILAMESKKRVYMLELLNWVTGNEEALEIYWNFVRENSEKIWNLYSAEIDICPELLAKIMLVDACFLIMYLILQDVPYFTMPKQDFDLLKRDGVLLKRDVVLLENQIPFFVLHSFYDFVEDRIKSLCNGSSLKAMILKCYKLTPISDNQLLEQAQDDTSVSIHLLDVIRNYHCPLETRSDGTTFFLIKSAKKLVLSGVTIQCTGNGSKLLDLRFSKGVLYIPPLIIDDYTETLLINLVAYEHVSPHLVPYFTSYVFFMSQLIESKHDLKLLEKKGIILTRIGSRKKATELFSTLSTKLVLQEFRYSDLCSEIASYVNTPWQRHKQVLKRKYFDNPWTALSVFAATVLLLLTLLQTIYALMSFYQKKSPAS